jgi:hypothetical protein
MAAKGNSGQVTKFKQAVRELETFDDEGLGKIVRNTRGP